MKAKGKETKLSRLEQYEQLWGAAITAEKDGKLGFGAVVVQAGSHDEAVGKVLRYGRQTFLPMAEGWIGHQASMVKASLAIEDGS